jgi:hypothetical protein
MARKDTLVLARAMGMSPTALAPEIITSDSKKPWIWLFLNLEL